MKTHTAAMVLVGAVAGLGRLGGGSGRCFGPPWAAGFGSHQRLRIAPDRDRYHSPIGTPDLRDFALPLGNPTPDLRVTRDASNLDECARETPSTRVSCLPMWFYCDRRPPGSRRTLARSRYRFFFKFGRSCDHPTSKVGSWDQVAGLDPLAAPTYALPASHGVLTEAQLRGLDHIASAPRGHTGTALCGAPHQPRGRIRQGLSPPLVLGS